MVHPAARIHDTHQSLRPLLAIVVVHPATGCREAHQVPRALLTLVVVHDARVNHPSVAARRLQAEERRLKLKFKCSAEVQVFSFNLQVCNFLEFADLPGRTRGAYNSMLSKPSVHFSRRYASLAFRIRLIPSARSELNPRS